MADINPPDEFGTGGGVQPLAQNAGVPGPGNKIGCPPGFTADAFGRCLPSGQPAGGGVPGGSPTAGTAYPQGPYNCCKSTVDGSLYPTGIIRAAGTYPPGFVPPPGVYVRPSNPTADNAPVNPNMPDSCPLSWSINRWGGVSGNDGQGTYQDYLKDWVRTDIQSISFPQCDPFYCNACQDQTTPDPTMPPCSYCSQPSGTNSSCPVCTINVNTQPIADAIKKLLDKIENTAIECDQISSTCLDSIARQVKDILDSEGMTCSECCQAIADGVALTASEALVCASCECTNLENQCSPGLGYEDGSTCQGCGQAPCCCNAGVCEPCEQTSPQSKFIGYYNCVTGETAVGRAGGVAFGPPWVALSPMDDEAAALAAAEEAVAYCAKPVPNPSPSPPPPQGTPLPPGCDISQFSTPDAAGAFMRSMAGSQLLVGAEATVLQAAKSVFQIVGDELGSTLGAYELGQALLGPITSSVALSPLVATMLGCGNNGTIQGLTALSTLGVAGNLAGVDYTQFSPQIVYAIHAACRNRQLSPDSAMSAYLANQIDYGTLDTHWAINGICPQGVAWAAESSRSKPIPSELIQLNNRGVIDDQQFADGMRRLGYTDGGEVNALKSLGQIYPPYSDIVRMMVRDAGDNNLVQRFGLDTDFTTKYSDQLKQWAKGQGVSDQIMQYLWRSHWSIPAPGQLFEMYHRLRKSGQFGTEAEVLQDVTTALEQQDILPFWIPRLLAISFRPLTRVDARRAFQVGAIDEQGVFNSYIDQGYSDANAQILTDFTKRLKSIGIRNEPAIKLWLQGFRTVDDTKATLKGLGYSDSDISQGLSIATAGFANGSDAKALIAGEITLQDFINALVARGARQDDATRVAATLSSRITYNPAIDQYDAGLITADAAKKAMVNAGMSDARAGYFIKRIDGRQSIAAARSCANAVRKQFLTGGLSAQDAQKALQSAGIVAERASLTVSRWGCELAARTRQPSVSMLCKWLGEGSISADDFLTRAQRLGFSVDDSVAILADCNFRINTARNKQAIANAKAQAAAAAKAQRQIERAEAAVLAEQANLVKARRMRAQAISRRNKTQFAIVDNIMGLTGMNTESASSLMASLLTAAKNAAPLSIDDALEVVTRAVDSWNGIAQSDLQESVAGLAALYNSDIDELSQPDDAYPFNTGG